MALVGILGVLVTPLTQVVKCLTIPVARQIQYIIQYETNTKELKIQLEELVEKMDGVNLLIDEGRMEGKSTKTKVQHWINKVKSFHDKAKQFLDDGSIHERANSCIVGCPSRYRIGKKAKKMVNLVYRLKTEGEFNVVSVRMPPPGRECMPSGDFEVFDVTRKAMEEVMEGLKNPKVNLIAVYGIPGVGKTTLMEEVGKQARKDDLFDVYVKATVSQKIDLKNIQGEIAECLGFTLQEGTESARELRLFGLLKEDPRRILIILDDLWQRIELSKVGIPLAYDQSFCKVVITTRRLDVCNVMDAQVKVKLELLSEKDSLFLLRKKAGNINVDPSLSTVSRVVAKECKGLPLAIVTLGRALRGKDQQIWVDTASQLRKSISTGVEDMNVAVTCIRKSYDFLEGKNTKLCFLLCGLFPEDYRISIEVLMWYMVVEESVDIGTLEEARGMVRMFCNKLKDSNLLLKDRNDNFVIMHDVIRDVAVQIAKENGFLSLSYSNESIHWPERKKLDKYIRISMMNTKIVDLPSQPVCPKLLMLLLRNNKSLVDIPNSFFEQMKNITVLDLSNNSISVLPQSIPCITQLRTLFLESCSQLKDVSLIGQLKNLEVLSLKCSSIEMLPEEIGGLTSLRLLNLSKTEDLKSIPPNVISKLSCLEELYMSNSFSGWEAENGDGINASLCEVISLTRLTALYLHVKNAECLLINIPNNHCNNLQRFHISFNDRYWGSSAIRSMCLDATSSVSDWFKVLAYKTEELSLVSCNDLKNVAQLNGIDFNNLKSMRLISLHRIRYAFSPSMIQRLHQLEEINIQNCRGMVTLFSTDDDEQPTTSVRRNESRGLDNMPFASLRTLKLANLRTLSSLYQCQRGLVWPSLEELEVYSCPNLKTLPFSPHNAPKLRIIDGSPWWFDTLEWSDESLKLHFQPLFRRRPPNCYRCRGLPQQHLDQPDQGLTVGHGDGDGDGEGRRRRQRRRRGATG